MDRHSACQVGEGSCRAARRVDNVVLIRNRRVELFQICLHHTDVMQARWYFNAVIVNGYSNLRLSNVWDYMRQA